MMIETLESRRLMSVDISLSALTTTVPSAIETTALAKLKSTAKFTLTNTGTEALPKTTPALTLGVFLRDGSGNETLISSLKPTKYGGLKVGAKKTISAPLKILPGQAQGPYTIVARADTTDALVESDETNNLTTGANTSIVPGGTALFAAYGFSDSITCTATGDNNSAISESGSFVDSNGVTGTYLLTINGPLYKRYQTTITLSRTNAAFNQVYITSFFGKKVISSLNGKHVTFSAKGGGTKFNGSPTASGQTIFVKVT